MQTISVKTGAGSYPVVFGRGAIRRLRKFLARFDDGVEMFVLSSPRVWRNCGREILRGAGTLVHRQPILFDDAESAKNLQTVGAICRKLVRAGADRRCVLVAVGGGVVGDVAGFVAASYLRGVRLVHVPTTLVAQIDSSIGGKTGVDLPEGKNLVGAFYPPQLVVADPNLLRSLPDRQYRSGIYEVVKYGVIGDVKLFDRLERNMAAILRREPKAVELLIPRCIRLKAGIVSKDERESGLRQVLNFGHTLGHAFETAGNYRRYLHGEAVGWGILAATLLGLATARLDLPEAQRIARAIASVGGLPSISGIRAAKLLPLTRHDKKARAGRVGWVLSRGIGRVDWGIELPEALVARVICELPDVARLARGAR